MKTRYIPNEKSPNFLIVAPNKPFFSRAFPDTSKRKKNPRTHTIVPMALPNKPTRIYGNPDRPFPMPSKDQTTLKSRDAVNMVQIQNEGILCIFSTKA